MTDERRRGAIGVQTCARRKAFSVPGRLAKTGAGGVGEEALAAKPRCIKSLAQGQPSLSVDAEPATAWHIGQAISVWQGNDATQFQDWWNSQHKPALMNASEAIAGLGQSALNNAQAQESASGA